MKTLKDAIAKIEELESRIVALETLIASQPTNTVRDRGPSSTREMTEADARLVMIGEHKELSHRKAAELLGLSYGQIYSARNGYTFKGVYKEMKDLEK